MQCKVWSPLCCEGAVIRSGCDGRLHSAGWSLSPKHHPLVLAGGGAVYWAMMKYRFPISASIDVAKFKSDKRDVKVQLVTATKRVDDNPISTTNVSGVVLCMNV